ncbi:hypothetical protein HII36_24185 [Nonomuraea sp. NN258]|uniref:conjugal transfer protein n=1 Tax=Nonomuraea antri TaxID=2730852 RepID=UPI00156A673C|nr:conjugal transfer protein [Nonomuraea antri]NRQ34906.1 hypothetical protein [Nonomuraea antri]
MDLPTYTNIWRIEKRLYKLYDLRLPMPLPIVWIGVFVGVFVPWSLLLILVGVPVAMPWHVLFLVPPGIVTWLSTRPVIEGKRLTELLESQLRYLGQPRAWYRLAPMSEPETITFSGRVWRASAPRVKAKAKVARKAKQPQRRRESARPAGPRQVRPAVAAAAAAARQAPVAEPAPTRWGAESRRGAAPALTPNPQVRETAHPQARDAAAHPQVRDAGTPVIPPRARRSAEQLPGAPASPPVPPPASPLPASSSGSSSASPSVPSEPVAPVRPDSVPGPRPEALPALPQRLSEVSDDVAAPAGEPGAGFEAGEVPGPTPAEAHDADVEADAEVEAASGTPAEESGAEAGERASEGEGAGGRRRGGLRAVPSDEGAPARERHDRAAGKPIDTEALRRLRRLAASADAPEESAGEPDDERPDDEVARDQHRKGQPPRLGPALVLSETQRMWPPLNPDAKPAARRQEPRQADPGDAGRARKFQAPAAAQGPMEPAARDRGAPAAQDRQGTHPPSRPGEPRVRRVESVVGRDPGGGWRRIAQVVVGGGGMRDGSEIDEARARGVFGGSRRIVVLGCTGGAGQSTTALMLGHTFATYRDDRVVAVDANTGGDTLTSKIQPETPETLTSLLAGLDQVSGYLTMRGYTTRTASGLEVISADTDADAERRLADRSFFSDHRLGESMRLLDRHYKLAVIDPAAALAARVLPYADQLVLVVPASEEAPEAVQMTYEWLDGHGCAELRRRAVMVVNGVSRRSMADVEQAESVASGRCRAIVRVPWEDDLAPDGAEVVDPGQLRAAGRRAYLALAGVVVAGFAAQTVRPSEEELASDPPGTRIGER